MSTIRTRGLLTAVLSAFCLIPTLTSGADQPAASSNKSGAEPSWIWSPAGRSNEQTVYFRKEFVLDTPVIGAKLMGSCDNRMILYLNGEKIAGIGAGDNGRVTYDFPALTILPGLIDAHVHIGAHFGKDGRASTPGETPAEQALAAAGNAYALLMAGFTTVQSVGAASDVPLNARGRAQAVEARSESTTGAFNVAAPAASSKSHRSSRPRFLSFSKARRSIGLRRPCSRAYRKRTAARYLFRLHHTDPF